jgi:1-acyl-sn-glycerol-3-phosphate acyltransferase
VLLSPSRIPELWGDNPERGQSAVRHVVAPLTRALAPSFGYGVERVPLEGGLVIAANHLSGIDPPLIGTYSRRALYYMAKAELLEVPAMGEFLRWMGTFAVRRGEGDRDAIRLARWLVSHGHAVCLFMEGTRQRLGHPGPAHPGGVMVAVQEGVPIVPCGVDSFRWSVRSRRPCAVVWGEPITLDVPKTGKGYKQGARLLEEELARLWRMAAVAAADGFPEVLPDGARRHGIVWPWGTATHAELTPWPAEEWARGPRGLDGRTRR